MTVLQICSLVMLALCLGPAAYLGFLAVLAREPRALAPAPAPARRFAIVVPAHDEEAEIGNTVRSLGQVTYASELVRVVVVADNCTDATEERAREAGAEVWVRDEPDRRGKGYALELAFGRLVAQTDPVDAVVVVDADTLVSENLLNEIQRALDAGAQVVQAEYGVRNVDASWRTRLMTVALAMVHRLRMLARERLRLSVGLRGNGMCFTRELLARHPYGAFGLVEDVEFGVQLALAGHRVWYAQGARVWGEMAASSGAATSQRRRWEGGRFSLLRTHLPGLLRAAISRRSLVLADLAVDLLILPLSYIVLAAAVGSGLELLDPGAGPFAAYRLAGWAAVWLGLSAYVVRGVSLSGLGWRGWAALGWAPAYVVWKLIWANPMVRDRTWIRTRRSAEETQDDRDR